MEAGHRVLRMAICTHPDVGKTKSSFRLMEYKARGTSYCNASGYIELRTAPRKADMASLHGKSLSKRGCKWCIVYHMDFLQTP